MSSISISYDDVKFRKLEPNADGSYRVTLLFVKQRTRHADLSMKELTFKNGKLTPWPGGKLWAPFRAVFERRIAKKIDKLKEEPNAEA